MKGKIIKKTKNKKNNECWFDKRQECPFYQEIKGFIDAGPRCGKCQYFDRQRFIDNYYSVVYSPH